MKYEQKVINQKDSIDPSVYFLSTCFVPQLVASLVSSLNHLFLSGLLATQNLIQLPQQSQGGLLTTPPRMGLQAQVGNVCDRGE